MKEQNPVQSQAIVQESVDADTESYIVEEIAVEELAIDGICGVY